MARNGAGWSIVDLWEKDPARAGRGRRWLARAWDPRKRKHRNQSFPDHLADGSNGHAAAERWVRAKSSSMRLGQDSAGTVSFAAVASTYLDQLKDEGRCEEHRREVKRVADSLTEAGIDDLLAKDFPLKARSHIVAWRDVHKFRKTKVDEEGEIVLFQRGPKKGQPVREGRLLAASTRHRYLGHVKAIAKHAVTWDHLLKNPMDKVSLDKGEEPQPSFTIDEVARLVVPGDEPFYPIFLNMIYGGLRLGEAAHLRFEWQDWGGNRLHVRRHPAYRLKGNRERSVPMQPEWKASWEKQLRDLGWMISEDELRRMVCAPPANKKDPKAPRPDSKKAWSMFREFVDGRGVTCGDRSPHSCRHTWVAAMLATGEDSAFVQLWAGHREIDTTLGYAEARDAMRDAVKGWPRGELRFLQRAVALGLTAAA